MDYIITKNKKFFEAIGNYNYCNLEDMKLPIKIAYDCETTGLNAMVDDIFAIQIGTGKDNYLIDLQEYSDSDTIDVTEVIPYVSNKILVGHNIGFDLGFLYKHDCYPESVRDTMIASMLLYNGDDYIKRHSFGHVMERELGIEYDKSEQKNIHKVRLSTSKAIRYCFNDVDRLLELEEDMTVKLQDYDAFDTYKLNCNYLKGLTYMEMCGIPIDEKQWSDKMIEDQEQLDIRSEEIKDYIYTNLPKYRETQLSLFEDKQDIIISLSSPKQMLDVFKDLEIPIVDDEGKESIDESVLNKTNHEFVDMWLNFKEYQHRVTTFGENILSKQVDGRLYTRFKPILDTCRIASRRGEINFLNFPSDPKTRDCFRAKPGNKIIVCDFDNQEAVTLADKSQNTATLKSIIDGADSHSILAREVFPEIAHLSDKEIKQDHNEKRQIGKIANFTFSFGGTGYTAAKNLNISLEEGERIYNAYRKINKETFEWGESILKQSLKTGYIESADGFKLKLPYYNEYLDTVAYMKTLSREDWNLYKIGKKMYKDEENREDYIGHSAYEYYLKLKPVMSKWAKARSKYMRLCLNNPIQSTAAHMTKKAVVNLFDYIKDNHNIGDVKICNVVHDEIILEVKEELVEQYTEALGKIMRDAADTYLLSGLVKMGADANVGESWYEAK